MNKLFVGIVSCVALGVSGVSVASDVCKTTNPETGVVTFGECGSSSVAGGEKVDIEVTNTAESKDITRGKGFKASPHVSHQSKTAKNNAKKSRQAKALDELNAAKEIKAGDRVNTANGSRLSEDYFKRVEEAEAKYKAATGK